MSDDLLSDDEQALTVACPETYCLARPEATCRTAGGLERLPHAKRIRASRKLMKREDEHSRQYVMLI